MIRLPALLAIVAASLAAAGSVAPPAEAATVPARTVMLHRINVVRALYGLAPVRGSSTLHVAAIRHSDDMLSRDYFAHTSPSGSTIYDRIVATGYVNGYAWAGGETLAWGTGTLGGVRATVRAWLHSPEHRAILLSPTYRAIGAARACGRFMGHSGACVWTVDWVRRW
jgi:uncharacterized protein YkwD